MRAWYGYVCVRATVPRTVERYRLDGYSVFLFLLLVFTSISILHETTLAALAAPFEVDQQRTILFSKEVVTVKVTSAVRDG